MYRNHRPSDEQMRMPWDGSKPLRLKTPTITRMKWHDSVRGDLEAGEEALDDFIIMKSDGYPTYNFAHIIDDHEMGVTHILRGEEFISSTPKYLSLYEALGFIPPVLATLPPILRDDKTKKLGKRDGAKDILEYRKDGYLPEAMVNILALIGWNPGTEQEIFSMAQLKKIFDIAKVQKSGGVFNEDKLMWFNREYIALLSDQELITQLNSFLSADEKKLLTPQTISLIREKIHILSDTPKLFEREGELAFIQSIVDYPATLLLWKKNPDSLTAKKHLTEVLTIIKNKFSGNSDNSKVRFTPESIKDAIWSYVETHGRGDVLWPLRVALTAQEKSPDPFVSASLLGLPITIERINSALQKL